MQVTVYSSFQFSNSVILDLDLLVAPVGDQLEHVVGDVVENQSQPVVIPRKFK